MMPTSSGLERDRAEWPACICCRCAAVEAAEDGCGVMDCSHSPHGLPAPALAPAANADKAEDQLASGGVAGMISSPVLALGR